jgi:hypothetical protein
VALMLDNLLSFFVPMELKELELTDVAGHIKPTAIELTLIVILWLYSLRKNGSNE